MLTQSRFSPPLTLTATALAFVAGALCLGAIHQPPTTTHGGPVAPRLAAVAARSVAPAPKLVVHEWGTFNHMSGAPGIVVEGLQHEDEVLPAFVYSRTTAQPSPWAAYGDDSYRVTGRGVRSKMETPVVYFYSDVEQHVTLDVAFTRGLHSEWYPHARAEPPLSEHETIDVETLPLSRLIWDLDVLPVGTKVPLKEVGDDEPWAIARGPASSPVRTKNGETESYLFYRGLGGEQLPLAAGLVSDDCVNLVEAGTARDRAVTGFAVQIRGAQARFSVVDRARAKFGGWQKKAEAVAAMQSLMTELLVGRGLYIDEADAMVKTWTRTWFHAEGNRVLYLLDDSATERMLPMAITPQPTELVRVLVGRLEYLTPTDKAEIATAVDSLDRATLAKRGRFLEPILRSVAAQNPSAKVGQNAVTLLNEFRADHD